MSAETKSGGLAGVVAGQTGISTVGKEGVGLTYRGYAIEDLAGHSTFEEVAWLLLRGELPTSTELTHFRHLLHGTRPNDVVTRALDASLILYAEHEFNASTFATRITASTLADFYSAITSGIGTLRGPLHGGANEEAMALIEKFKTPDE